jgi:radical SAM protein with 4Fe4S-binding SPASM domain
MDLRVFTANFLPFLHTLYAYGLDVAIDGIYTGVIDKHILDNHGKFILSPDGYIYPEYDFLEYKRDEYRIGKWDSNPPVLNRTKDEDSLLLKSCRTCESRPLCGLKYMYAMFSVAPGVKCKEFYQIIDITAKHLYNLKSKPSMLHWVPPNAKT